MEIKNCEGYCALPVSPDAYFIKNGEIWCKPCFHMFRAAQLAERGMQEAAERCLFGE